jgi:hypothetical protein
MEFFKIGKALRRCLQARLLSLEGLAEDLLGAVGKIMSAESRNGGRVRRT